MLVDDWQTVGLVKPSVAKPVFTTIERGLILRTMGTMTAGDLSTLRAMMPQIIG